MKRIINWIKHEYRIAKDIDKPTHLDYQIVYFLYWWVLTPLMVFLYLLSCIVLSWILPSTTDERIVTSFFLIIFLLIFELLDYPVYLLLYKNGFYEL